VSGALSITTGACVSVSPSGVSTGRTLLPCVRAVALTLAEAGLGMGGEDVKVQGLKV